MNYYLSYVNKKENFLVYILVFAAWWQFMLGLHHFDGGVNNIWKAIYGEKLLYLVIFITTFICNRNKQIFQHTGYNKKLVLIFTFCYFPILFHAFLSLSIGALLPFLLIVIFIQLRDDLKVRVFDTFIRVMAISLFLSIIEYVFCVVTSKYVTVFASIPLMEFSYKVFDQSLFNFIPLHSIVNLGPFSFFKFQSLSDEPGNVGTVCAFLLYATSDSKRYKYPYIVFWISGILSFSAAFYILAAIHLVFSLKRKNVKIFIVGGVLVYVLYHYFQEAFDLFIFNRFSKENLNSLDNRSTEEFDALLMGAFRDGSLWFGKGYGAVIDTGGHGGAAGYKVYLWIYGIIGTIFVLFGYISVYLKILKCQLKSVRKPAIIFLLIFLLSFYQREYINYFDYVVLFFTMPIFLSYKELVEHSQNNSIN